MNTNNTDDITIAITLALAALLAHYVAAGNEGHGLVKYTHAVETRHIRLTHEKMEGKEEIYARREGRKERRKER